MENYRKASTVEEPCPCPFRDLPPDTPQVRVNEGSKIRNILSFAFSRVEAKPRPRPAGKEDNKEHKPGEGCDAMETEDMPSGATVQEKPLSRQIVFTANGKGISKAITCTEIVKRRLKGVHQHTALQYSAVREVWDPLEPAAGLDSLTVSRKIPAVWILLSRDPLDPALPGYQAPGNFDSLWAQALLEEEGEGGGRGGARSGARKRRGGGFGGGGGGSRGRGGTGRPAGRPRGAGKGQC